MKLLERIVLQIFPGLRRRLAECEYNASAAAQLSSVAVTYAYKALEASSGSAWSGGDDVGPN